jgi:hypothetical protein
MNAEQLEVDKKDPLLRDAWKDFADYDLNAGIQQDNFRLLQFWILLLSGLASLVALSYTQLVELSGLHLSIYLKTALRWLVIVTPVSMSILVTASNIFKPGGKWVPLRKAAEDIKSEIYRYRTLAHLPAADDPGSQPYQGSAQLREKISQVSGWLMETEISTTAIHQYKGSLPPRMDKAKDGDDGFSPMTPDRYIEIRLGDQLSYYTSRTAKLARQLKQCQWLIVVFGGIGTFLAAIGLELWVALATTLVGIFTTSLEYRQLENNLKVYNQARHSLKQVAGWWSDLPPEQKEQTANISKLVDSTEQVLQSELSRWIKNMETALDALKAKQAEKIKKQ